MVLYGLIVQIQNYYICQVCNKTKKVDENIFFFKFFFLVKDFTDFEFICKVYGYIGKFQINSSLLKKKFFFFFLNLILTFFLDGLKVQARKLFFQKLLKKFVR
jgi:hypothetical protein